LFLFRSPELNLNLIMKRSKIQFKLKQCRSDYDEHKMKNNMRFSKVRAKTEK